MIEPYNAVGLIPTVWGVSQRSEIMRNIDHHRHMVKAAAWLASLDLPVRLVALPEGALQGFNDEVLDLDHATFADTCAVEVPGPETEALGEICRTYGVYLMAQAKARHPEWPDRFFNVGFILDDAGELILVHTRRRRCFPWSTRFARTTCTTGGSSVTGARSMPSGRWLTPRSADLAS